MRRHLTDTFCRYVKPTRGQVDYFASGFPGLAFRVNNRTKTWFFIYRREGKFRRLKLGSYPQMSLKDAHEAWRSSRMALAAGKHPIAPAAHGADAFLTIAQLWLKRDQAGNRTVARAARVIMNDCQPLHGMRISEITRRDIRELLRNIEDRAPTMARRVYGHLHRLFTWALSEDHISLHPMSALPKPGSEVSRDRVLSDDELVAVWRACEVLGWPWGPLVQLLVLTGARRSEIGELRWSEVNDYGISLRSTRTKAGVEHDIPLSSLARGMSCRISAPPTSSSQLPGRCRYRDGR